MSEDHHHPQQKESVNEMNKDEMISEDGEEQDEADKEN